MSNDGPHDLATIHPQPADPVSDPGHEEHLPRLTDVDEAAADRATRQIATMVPMTSAPSADSTASSMVTRNAAQMLYFARISPIGSPPFYWPKGAARMGDTLRRVGQEQAAGVGGLPGPGL